MRGQDTEGRRNELSSAGQGLQEQNFPNIPDTIESSVCIFKHRSFLYVQNMQNSKVKTQDFITRDFSQKVNTWINSRMPFET